MSSSSENKKHIDTLDFDRHYRRVSILLIFAILIGSTFWMLKRFRPTIFLGEPDFIAEPESEILTDKPIDSTVENSEVIEGKIDINSATIEQLESLPRIGSTMAQRIIDYRELNGKFSTIEELTEVKGIGRKTLEKLRKQIIISNETE